MATKMIATPAITRAIKKIMIRTFKSTLSIIIGVRD
jgi:hypothetical protein